VIVFQEDRISKAIPGRLPDGPAIIMAAPQESGQAVALAGIVVVPGFPGAEEQSIHFESREDYDYLSLYLPDFSGAEDDAEPLECYLTRERLVVIGGGEVFGRLHRSLETDSSIHRNPVQALALLFNLILVEVAQPLETVDDAIDSLEEKAARRKPEDHASEIIALRKHLAAIKHCFDALYDLLEELEENRNNLFTKNQLQLFRAYKNKINRLANRTLNLREHLTQVREAFQNQLDISLNDTMRFFTVITAIFLPLTLIVGWYGMNLRMPELESAITYPVIIGVSLGFIAISLFFCKKKGWF
jgi:magnesium transporter